MSALNETMIRDVVAEVLGRLGNPTAPAKPAAAAPAPAAACGCNGKSHAAGGPALRGKFGVFQDANEACAAAQEAFLQLKAKGVETRRKIENVV